jgi:DNA polymerase III alpha subunit
VNKITTFPIQSHRLYQDQDLNTKMYSLFNQNEDLFNLMKIYGSNEKVVLLVKSMIDKNDSMYFNDNRYVKRLTEELNVILNHNENYLLDFFLIYEDIANWIEEKNEVALIGRGAACSSLVNFLLGLHQVDPLIYELEFARFLTKDKSPDIDLDMADSDDLIDYLSSKYGYNLKQVQIKQYHKYKPALKTVLSQFKYERVSKLIELFEAREQGFIEQYGEFNLSRRNAEFFRYVLEKDQIVQAFFKQHSSEKDKILSILDTLRPEVSIHAAGFVLNESDVVFMDEIESLGYLRLDFLRLNVYKEINNKYDLDVAKKVLANVNVDGIKKMIARGKDNLLLGQSIKADQAQVSHPVEIKSLTDCAILIAKSRPTPLMMMEYYPCQINSEKLAKILQSTNHELVFQDQLIKIGREMMGLTDVESIKLMRSVSQLKKSQDYLDNRFAYVQALKETVNENAEELMQYIEILGPFLFNKGHAIAYSMIDYLAAN